MTENARGRLIEIFLTGSTEPLWAVRDTEVPAIGDSLHIEHSNGLVTTYAVTKRIWATAKQGESSFARVRLLVSQED